MKCRMCGIRTKCKADRLEWIIVDGPIGIVRQVVKSGDVFITMIEKAKFCSVDCLEDYLLKKAYASSRLEKEVDDGRV